MHGTLNPEGKCAMHCVGIAEHSGGNDLQHSQTTYLNLLGKVSGYALVRTLKSETCFPKKVVCFKYERTVSEKAIKLQYQTKTAESLRN